MNDILDYYDFTKGKDNFIQKQTLVEWDPTCDFPNADYDGGGVILKPYYEDNGRYISSNRSQGLKGKLKFKYNNEYTRLNYEFECKAIKPSTNESDSNLIFSLYFESSWSYYILLTYGNSKPDYDYIVIKDKSLELDFHKYNLIVDTIFTHSAKLYIDGKFIGETDTDIHNINTPYATFDFGYTNVNGMPYYWHNIIQMKYFKIIDESIVSCIENKKDIYGIPKT